MGGSYIKRPWITCIPVIHLERSSVSDINPPMIMDTMMPTSLIMLETTISFGVRASANVLKISNAVHSIEMAAKPIVMDSHLMCPSAHTCSH